MPGPTDLYAVADELLNAAVDSLNTIPDYDPSLLGAPERAFVSFGLPVLDCCAQTAVNPVQVLTAPTQSGLPLGKQSPGRIIHVYLAVTATRCVPVPDNKGNPPPVAEMVASAQQLDADAWALWNHLFSLWASGSLFSLCGEVFWDSLRPLGPQGGCAGNLLAIHISLSGYNESLSS